MYKVIDNLLPKEKLKSIQDVMLSTEFPWFFSDRISGPKEVIENYYFVHIFYLKTINSSFYNILDPIIEKLDANALVRIKGNLHPNVNKFIENNKHVDYDFQHKGAIFYVNTNNGFTILEDGTKIESIENRLLMFDPSKLHNSTNCTDKKCRVNINFNYF
jgi:hypothetical protein